MEDIFAQGDLLIERVPDLLPSGIRAQAGADGALVVAPPSVLGSSWLQGFGNVSTAFMSGWMLIRSARRRASFDRGFPISDHAACDALRRGLEASGRRASDVAAISFSAGAHTQVLEDADWRVLRPAIVWNDQRSRRERDREAERSAAGGDGDGVPERASRRGAARAVRRLHAGASGDARGLRDLHRPPPRRRGRQP